MKKLLITGVILGLALLPVAALAETEDISESNVLGGTIPFLAQWTVTADAHASSFSGILEADYDADYIEFVDFFDVTDFDANDTLSVRAKVGSWTKPSHYPAFGNKNTVTSESDLHIKVTDISEAADSLAIQGSFASYVELTSVGDQEILAGTTAHGIENAAFQADAKVDLDWVADVTGAYAITVTLTIYDERD